MSSLVSLVTADGPMKIGTEGNDVRALQIALVAAGYRADINSGTFATDTEYWVKRFQAQHGLNPDGVVGRLTAALLDSPHAELVATATPSTVTAGAPARSWPHDDTASLISFYGQPGQVPLVPVDVPFPMTYRNDDGSLLDIHHIQAHRLCAVPLALALQKIAEAARSDANVLRHIAHFSGSYNPRSVRGSSRWSCHAFGCAFDFDAERLELGHGVPASEMPQVVVDIFKSTGAFWGGDYLGRKDPMHFQYAHE